MLTHAVFQIALKNDVDYPAVLGMLKEARNQGLTTPVLLMGWLESCLSACKLTPAL